MDKITLPGFSPYYGPTTGFSRAFQNLIKDVGDSKSKYVRIIHYLLFTVNVLAITVSKEKVSVFPAFLFAPKVEGEVAVLITEVAKC